jgi:Protein of unknown function (DUF1552)
VSRARRAERATRRSFLRAVTAGAAAVPFFTRLPFFKLVEDAYAQSMGATLPLRFITMYHPHGIAAELWAMRAVDTETSFDLSYENCSLQPFDDAATYGKSWKSQLLVLEGIDHLSNANGHDSAGTILTGSRIDSSAAKPGNASLDQVLAVDHKLGAATPITSVALGVGDDSTKAGTTLSYGVGGAPLPKIIDPSQAFTTLFGGLAPANDPAATAALARQRKLGKSVLDFCNRDIARLRTRLAPPEQQKLDQHTSALADLEKQLGGLAMGQACTVPGAPDVSTFPKLKAYNGGEPYFDAITNAHIDLVAQAFACDVTRFATLFMADLSYMGNPLGLPADNHGAVAHTYNGSPVGTDGQPVGNGDPASWVPLAKFNRYAYSKVARLMQKLDALGVLGSTLIYATSDMGNPARHSTRNVPTVLAGGAGGKFRMGRRLKMPADCPTANPWCGPADATFQGTTNNHLLISIAQAFGVTLDTFGTQPDPKLTTGALPGLT